MGFYDLHAPSPGLLQLAPHTVASPNAACCGLQGQGTYCCPPCLQSDGFVPVLQGIGGYHAGAFILLELDEQQCCKDRLVGTIRCVDG